MDDRRAIVDAKGLNFEVDEDDEDVDLKELAARASDAGVSLDDMMGVQHKLTKETFGVPLLFSFEDDKRMTRFRQHDGVLELFDGASPRDGEWIEGGSRLTLKKALRQYKDNLLAFERVHRITTLDITAMNVRKRVEITTRVLVRKQR